MDSDRVEGGERKKMRMDRLGDGVQKRERGSGEVGALECSLIYLTQAVRWPLLLFRIFRHLAGWAGFKSRAAQVIGGVDGGAKSTLHRHWPFIKKIALASVLLLSSATWWMWHSVIDDICSTVDLTGCLRQALLYNIHSVMSAFYQILCNDAWTHDYYRYDKKLIGLWTWRHHYEEFIKEGAWAVFYSTDFLCLARGGFPQIWLQFLR